MSLNSSKTKKGRLLSRLDDYIGNYTDFNGWLISKRYELLSKYFCGRSCVELGCGDGSGTGFLADHFDELTVIDGSSVALEKAGKLFGVKTVHSFFEDVEVSEKYDTVVLAHVLEHVDNPMDILWKAREFVRPGGVLIVDVPNGDSLHRQLGVEMGMLSERTELNETDISLGHQRVYTYDSFKEELSVLDANVAIFGGMFIKLLSNAQTEQVFDAEQLEAMFDVGVNNPRIAAEIYGVLAF